jgi:hypothetical protein
MSADPIAVAAATSPDRSRTEVLALPGSEPATDGAASGERAQEAVVLDAIRRQSAGTGYATAYLVDLLLQTEPAETRPIIDRLVAAGRVTRTSLGHWGPADDHALRVVGDDARKH